MIGVMQGRLSPIYMNRIQIFPWDTWQNEFESARKLNIEAIEWTIDSFRFHENPLINENQHPLINSLSQLNGVAIPSITCDYFMENPFWKGNEVEVLSNLKKIISAMAKLKSHILVIPLVDNSSIANFTDYLTDFFANLEGDLERYRIKIAFETDLSPARNARFISEYDPDLFGLNYDIGNSASLGFQPEEEISKYGDRIINVHVKDRILGGSSVPLGTGNAKLDIVFQLLEEVEYYGNYILQTARSETGKDLDDIKNYMSITRSFLKK